VVTDASGIPLAVTITGSNVPDVKEMLHVVEAIPKVRGKVGHPHPRKGLATSSRGMAPVVFMDFSRQSHEPCR
jgi:hypothetical protein